VDGQAGIKHLTGLEVFGQQGSAFGLRVVCKPLMRRDVADNK
jgi:hypothetical protein